MKHLIKFICMTLCCVLFVAGCAPSGDSSASKTDSSKTDSASVSSNTASKTESEAVSSKAPIVHTELTDEVITVEGSKYKMTFFDDFLGTELDTTKWTLCPQQRRQDVGGKWSNECTSLDGNGNLILTAKLDENNVPISGAIRSKGKFEQAQGYFECRARLQKSPGFWGAFWIMSSSMGSPFIKPDGTAEDGVELDIFESNSIFMKDINNAIHWDGYTGDGKRSTNSNHNTNCYDGEFHTFSMLWTDTAYIFYIDGKEVFRAQEGYENYPGCCKDACYLKATVEFGSWAGPWDAMMLPDNVAFDYIKVYQKVD